MTIQEIKAYLKEHPILIFRYNSEYYSLRRSRSLFGSQYCLMPTDGLPQQRSSLEELCEHVHIGNGTVLMDAIEHIEIPEWDAPSWETYKAVRHCAIIHGNEIHFFYRGKDYWIAHTNDGIYHLSDNLGNTQLFNSCRTLFEDARIDGSTLEEIWEDVDVDAC